ncbi:carboxypeptidase regulatory-like domain-containing protein [Elizabethkingia anophelis]|nr:carboxypeptidase regulatory-like domain-containing protein [Elizabethkingia anophelis]MCT4275448.1 carboxypeptidase regulatory-like domain-containing protein [Elizabethkingia anophelis]MCT4278234.1 carboxypeptidase regulatory-like domain-containing protein [Elizabethkingia anophelis]
MKKLLTLLFFMATFFLFAQKTISGKVSDTSGNGIASASVTIENPDNPVIIAYGITDSKGNYKIVFNTDLSKINIKVKAFNQKPQTKEVSNQDQTVNFSLASDVTEIKEVVLKTKLITKRGDTIAYDLKAFANKNDRVLADALKKIPGIDVNKDGTILYQGEPLNKFYVNGKDLMEGGYGTINNSLPIDAIGKVEIMENHQPVKILQDKVPSDRAAINIKLKKSVTMTGRGEIGLGASPLLWNVKLTPMLFTDKVQWLFNYKSNNNGDAVENEGNILSFGSRYEGIRRNITQNSWLNVDNSDAPNIPQKRYLMNSVHYLSGNLLTNLNKSKEWEFKANASYTNNAVERDSYNETQYIQQVNDGAIVKNDIKNNFYTDKVKGEVIFTKNAKKGFFKNTTTLSQFWNGDRAVIDRSITQNSNSIANPANEALESPTTSFQNSLSTIIPWKEKLINVRSFINYQTDRQTLRVDPIKFTDRQSFDSLGKPVFTPIFSYSPNAKIAEQYLRMKTFETSNAVNVSFSTKKWTFTPEVGFSYVTNKLNTTLFGVDNNGYRENYGDNYSNNLEFTNTTPTASTQINYKGANFSMYLTLPVNFNNIKATDPVRKVAIDLQKTTFEPSLFAQYEFASFWKASVNGNINYNFGTISNVYAGYILQTPSSLIATAADGVLSQNRVQSSGARIEYRNPLNNLFFNIRGSVSNTRNNLMVNTTYNGGGATLSYIVRDNDINTNSQSFEVGKYFPKFKTNASVSFTNSNNKSLSLNNNLLQRSKNNNENIAFKFNNAYFSWMSLDYTMSYGWGNNLYTTQGRETTVKSNNWTQNLNLIFYPIENHSIGLNWDQTNFSQGGQSFQNPFYDLTYQYTWAKKKIDFEVKWLNIANTKVYEQIGNSSVGTTYRRMFIRPSQIMFTVKFNFK